MDGILEFTSKGPSVEIGKFTIRNLPDGSVWMLNEIGEGMQFKPDLLEPKLREFFKENF